MKLKKLACLCLASVMALALAVPSFAAAKTQTDGEFDTAGANTVSVTGSTEVPTLKVTIPTTTKLIINPYGMTVTANTTLGVTNMTDKENAQVISPTYYATNLTKANVKVKVSAVGANGGSAGSDFALSEKPIATQKSATDRVVFLYVDTAIASKDQEKVTWPGFSSKATDSQAVITTTAATVKNEYVLAASADGTALAKNGGVLAFKIDGDANGNPDSAKAWTADDTANVTLTFTLSVTSDISTYEANQAAAG